MLPELTIKARLDLDRFALNLDLSLPLSGTTAIFGPSGCGKTSALRVIAGLSQRARGEITAFGEVWMRGAKSLPAHRRGVGYVFQDAQLFPHLSVAENLGFGARRRGRGRVSRADVIEVMDLGPLLSRAPETLSGGERQRVALGRCLLSEPRLLLLDEPMSALDSSRREDLLPYLRHLMEMSGLPAIYVSHAVEEVQGLADRVLLMEGGQVTARGGLELLPGPALIRLTGRVGERVETGVCTELGLVRVGAAQTARTGDLLALSFTADKVLLTDGPGRASFAQAVLAGEVVGMDERLHIRVADQPVTLPLPRLPDTAQRLSPGAKVQLLVTDLEVTRARSPQGD